MNIAATKALVPFQGFLPSRAGNHDLRINLDRHSDRFREEIILKAFTRIDTDDGYGPDGKEVLRPNNGNFLDMYI